MAGHTVRVPLAGKLPGPRRRPVAIAGAVVFGALLAVEFVGRLGAVGVADAGSGTIVAEVVDRAVRGSDCLVADEAIGRIRAAIDAAGMAAWTIRAAPGAASATCVGEGIDADNHTIVIMPGVGAAAAALDDVAARLMSGCLDRQQATQLLLSTVRGAGVEHAQIRTDGPLAWPDNQRDAVRRHLASGCTVFSGSGHDEAGHPVYYLSDPGS